MLRTLAILRVPVASGLREDLRYALRLLRKSPMYTTAALLILAMGIGANATVFSIVNGVLLRPLPFSDPDGIVTIWPRDDKGARLPMPALAIAGLQRVGASFEYVAAQRSFRTLPENDAAPVSVSVVSRDFLRLFRIRPQIGRDFSDDDLKPDAPKVALISHEYWRSAFGGDPNVLGRQVVIPDNPPLTVIGVLAPDVRSVASLGNAESVWTLMDLEARASASSTVFGRLRRGATAESVQAELTPNWDRVMAPPQDGTRLRPLVEPLLERYVRTAKSTLLIFAGAVAAVLLIVIVNLAGLELARPPEFQNELSIRSALGASRWRLMRLMAVKTLIVGLAGGALGVLVASSTHEMLVNRLVGVPRTAEIQIDWTVLWMAFVLSVFASLLIAVVPSIRAARLDVRSVLTVASPSYTMSRKYRLFQGALMSGETALALILLIAAGLLINNLWRILSYDIGLETGGVSSIRIVLPPSYSPPQRVTYFRELLGRFKSMSNVESAALTFVTPFTGGMYTMASPADGAANNRTHPIQLQGVSADYFSTLRIPLLVGRTFTEAEVFGGDPVAVVSETFAKTFWPDRNAVGERFQRRSSEPPITVIGVARDVEYGFYTNIDARSQGVDVQTLSSVVTERITAYVPIRSMLERDTRFFATSSIVLIRTSAPINDLVAVITDLEPRAAATPGPMSEFIAAATRLQRFQTTVLGGFGVAAALLAAIGVYGVAAHSVAQGAREIGIRVALGATRSNVFLHVCRRSLAPAVLGLAAGLVISFAMRRVLTGYLHVITPGDAPTYAAVTALMFIVVFAACTVPASRATSVDPVTTLRGN